ncbi:hypothetical protein [Azospirillum sp. sgz302134]
MNDDEIRSRLNRLEHGQDVLRGEMIALKEVVSDMKTTLSQLVPMMIRIDQKLSEMPSAAEFYELRGRVEEISRRQPTTLGYTPPPNRMPQG